jgi:hypothetical protein
MRNTATLTPRGKTMINGDPGNKFGPACVAIDTVDGSG